jgi:hypothetical protein
MKQRCYDKQNPNYGGRGIRVSKRWYHDFREFLADMGECPPGYSLDRVDNNKGYNKKNCRWIPLENQSSNRRNNVMVVWRGETKPLGTWARELGFSKHTLQDRWIAGRRGDRLFSKLKVWRLVSWRGKKQSLNAWAAELGLPAPRLYARFARGHRGDELFRLSCG